MLGALCEELAVRGKDGRLLVRVFGYVSKADRSHFGLLEAMDYRDAIRFLGRRYYVRQIWLTAETLSAARGSEELMVNSLRGAGLDAQIS